MPILFSAGDPFELLPRLFIGGSPDTHPTIGRQYDYLFRFCTRYHCDVAGLKLMTDLTDYDFEDEDKPLDPAIRDQVREHALFIKHLLAKDNAPTVAVSCLAGRNRSAMVGGMVMLYKGFTAKDTVRMIRGERRSALSNPFFVEELELLEADLKNG